MKLEERELPLMNTVQLEDYGAIWKCFLMEGDKVKADSLRRSGRLEVVEGVGLGLLSVVFWLFQFDFAHVQSSSFRTPT